MNQNIFKYINCVPGQRLRIFIRTQRYPAFNEVKFTMSVIQSKLPGMQSTKTMMPYEKKV